MKQPVDSRLPRVSFDFIVKGDIEIVVWSVNGDNDLYLAGRGRRPRRPEGIWVITVQPSVIFFDCRGDHWSSEVV